MIRIVVAVVVLVNISSAIFFVAKGHLDLAAAAFAVAAVFALAGNLK